MIGKELEKNPQLSEASRKMLEQAMTKMGLSAEAYDRILKVSGTIANMDEQKVSILSKS